MNNENKICNTKVEVPTGIELNDKDYINCLLSSLKELSKNYVCAMVEASNESLYECYRGTFLALADLQRAVYEIMFKKGWYCLEKVEEQKINEKYNMLSKEYNDLELEA